MQLALPVSATSTGATLTEWTVPTASSGPVNIILDPSGNCCWFVETFANKIAHFDPTTNTFQEWKIPTSNSAPLGIAAATISSQLAIIGTEDNGNKVFVFFPATGIIKEYPLPTASSIPEYVSIEPGGSGQTRAWFTEAGRNAWGELVYDPTLANAQIFEDTFPAAVGGIANGLYAGSGIVWFAGAKAVTRFDRSNLPSAYSMFPLPPHGTANGAFLTLDSLGQIWYTQGVANNAADANNYVGVLKNLNAFTDWQVPTVGADVRGLSIDPTTQQPWVAEYAQAGSGAAKVAVLDPTSGGTINGVSPTTAAYAGGVTTITPAVIGPIAPSSNTVSPTSASNTGVTTGQFTEWALSPLNGPHDLVVDSSGAVWIAESNGNKIGKLMLTQPDFSLGPAPGTISLAQGSSGSVTITGSSLLSYSGSVTLSITGSLPSGITSSFSTNPISIPSGGTASSLLTITVGPSAAVGSTTVTVTGTAGSLTHSTTFTLTVTSGADFALGLSAPSLSVGSGASNTDTVTVTSLGSFSSAVTLSASSLPGGVHVSFTPSSVTPPAGGSDTSVATISVDSGTPASSSTISITGTSGSLSHSQNLGITITVTSDFNLAAVPVAMGLLQGGSGTSTITVTSTNGFNSPVALSYSWLSAPTGVSISLPGPVTPSPGTPATSNLTASASTSASIGSFTLTIMGASGSLTHSLNIGIVISATPTTNATAPPKCLIATATYGSEVAPEVQLLRNFRDYSIMKTQAGSNFMVAFNAWYYSFSPYVASYLTTHWVERTIMKGVLYPLIGILYLTSNLFTATSGSPELAALLSGLLASSLIGAFYLGLPLSLLRSKVRRFLGLRVQGLLVRILAAGVLSGIGALLLGEFFSSSTILLLSSATIVLSTLFLSATVTSARIARILQAR